MTSIPHTGPSADPCPHWCVAGPKEHQDEPEHYSAEWTTPTVPTPLTLVLSQQPGRQPRIDLLAGEQPATATLTPWEARRLAQQLVDVADTADADGLSS